MLFNSYIFILFFLPLCLVVYFLLNHFSWKNIGLIFLTGMSLWFYGYANPLYLPVILGSVLVNYLCYYLMSRRKSGTSRKVFMIAGVIFNLALLGYFKYVDFFIENINAVFRQNIALLKIALPLGISFFTIQQISFVIDAYRGEIDRCSFIEYICFVTFFPQLVAGPIVTHEEILPQLRDASKKKPQWMNLSMGFYIFTVGMGKKLLLADTFGKMADGGFGIVERAAATAVTAELNSGEALLVLQAFVFQLYFDFSGYCDMAIGIAKMMNIDLPVNFNSPYKAVNIGDLWNRWHMTLNRFLTKYVYIPLGGSRKGTVRACINALIVFSLSGLWHGASWGFVVWGVINGIAMSVYRLTKKWVDKIPHIITGFFTFCIFTFSVGFFRSEKLSVALEFFRRLFSFKFGAINENLYAGFMLPEFEKVFDVLPISAYGALICMILFFVVAAVIVFAFRNSVEQMKRMETTRPRPIMAVAIAFLFAWCVVSLGEVSIFLYFNF